MDTYRVLIQACGDRGQDLSCLLLHHLSRLEEELGGGVLLELQEKPLTDEPLEGEWRPHFRVLAVAESADEGVRLKSFAIRTGNDLGEVLFKVDELVPFEHFEASSEMLAGLTFRLPGGIDWQVRFDRLMSQLYKPDFDVDAVLQMMCLLPEHMRWLPTQNEPSHETVAAEHLATVEG